MVFPSGAFFKVLSPETCATWKKHHDVIALPCAKNWQKKEYFLFQHGLSQNDNRVSHFSVRNYARVIFRREDGGSMLDFGALRDVCLIDRKIRRLPTFRKMAERSDRKLCLSWTLPNYVAAFHNKSTCAHITEEDVLSLQRASSFCLPFFLEGRLTEDCWFGERNNCPNAPDVCCRENLFHHIFTFVSDRESLGRNYTSSKYTLALLPVWSSLEALPLYKEMRAENLSTPNVKLLAIDMGLKDGLFETYFVEDALFMLIAAVMMIVILWIYTVSLFVTVMNVIAIFSSLIVAYFIYTFVLKIRFFPFMNLLTCVIMISIGTKVSNSHKLTRHRNTSLTIYLTF